MDSSSSLSHYMFCMRAAGVTEGGGKDLYIHASA